MNNIEINDETIIHDVDFNMFKSIGTEGFSLYCYFLINSNVENKCETTINMITKFFNNSNSNIKLSYGNKECNVSTLKDKKTIFKHINTIIRNDIIKIENSELSLKINKPFIVIPKIFYGNDEIIKIMNKFYLKTIPALGHVGWSLFCVLNILLDKDKGFANPTEKQLANILKKDEKTIKAYLKLLQEYKLITIENQEPMYKGKDCYNNDYFEFMPNKYFICQDLPLDFKTNINKKSESNKIIENNKGYIYIITTNNIEYKIGKTKDFNKRLGEYTLLPYKPKLKLLLEVNDYSYYEEKLHEKYKDKRLRGEWFKLNKKDIEYLTSDMLIKDIGDDFLNNIELDNVIIE